MKANLVTTKVTRDTLKNVKKIAAELEENQYDVIDRLVKVEAENLGLISKKKKK